MKFLSAGLITVILFLSQLTSFAQLERVTLVSVLHALEQRHQVSFTYLDEDIAGILVSPPADSLELSKALEQLSSQTGLAFSRLNNRFIAIQKALTSSITLCGRLLDRETKEPVVGAVVQAGPKYVVSDEKGSFRITLTGWNVPVSVRTLGYAPVDVSATDFTASPCRELFLTLTTQWLPDILIATYPTLGISKLLEGSYSIQTKSLGILPGLIEPDVLFAAQTLPGVQSLDETVSNINVRSGTQDQNLLLWDGMRMYQAGHFFGLISAFNPQITKSVQLTKNGTTAAYGEGVSSTIDIRSDNRVAQRLTGGAGINLISADAFLHIPLSRTSSAQIAIRRSLADVVTTAVYQKYYDRAFQGTLVTAAPADSTSRDEQFIFYDLSAKYLVDVTPKDKIRLNLFQAKNEIEIESTVLQTGEIRRSSLNQQSTSAGLFYDRNWNPRWTTSVSGYVSDYQLASINQDMVVNQELKQGNEVLDLGLKLESRFLVNSLLDLRLGYHFNEVGVTQREEIDNPPFNKNKKEVMRSHVLFAEGAYTSFDRKLTVNLGLRANYYGKLDVFRLEPRLTLSRRLSDRFTVELLAEMKSQTMVQVIDFQNDFLGVEKRKWVLANDEDIPWIRSKQASLGLHFQQENFLISTELFGKRVDNILSSSQGFQDQYRFVRAPGEYTALGIDALVSRKLNAITTWTSYSFSVSDYTFESFTPSRFRNNYDIRHRVTVGLTYQRNHWEFALGLNWRTGKPYTPPDSTLTDTGTVSYQDPNTASLPNYARVDFSMRYKFRLSNQVRAIAGLSVWNLLDRENLINIYFIPGSTGQPVAQVQYALSITPNLMFRVEF